MTKGFAKLLLRGIVHIVGFSFLFTSVAFASITLPENLTTIEAEAFSGNINIKELRLPVGLNSISERAFAGCTSLSLVTIPDSVTSIHDSAFDNCPNAVFKVFKDTYAEDWVSSHLREFTYMDDEIQHQGDYTYSVSKGINLTILRYNGTATGTLVVPATINGYNVTKIGEEAFRDCPASRIELPNTVVELGHQAFNYCDVEELILPDSLTTISSWAFSGCSKIKSIRIPNSVTNILGNPFYGCHGLESIIIDASHPVYGLYQNALVEKSTMKLITIPYALVGDTLTIPDGIKVIGNCAFGYSGPKFKKVIIPDSVETIESSAFCFSPVEYVEIGSGIKTMEYGPFTYCAALKHVTIKDGTTVIGNGAFSHCESLESIVIPDSVTSIANDAFDYDYYVSFVANPGSYAMQYATEHGISIGN